MNHMTTVLVVLLTASAASGCRDEIARPADDKSVGQEIEDGLHDADHDDDIDEDADEAEDKAD